MTLPLDGIRVLDLSRVLAGPNCAAFLSDMGADVVKVESTDGGDETRGWVPRRDGESAAFLALNRNKRSMALNLKTDEGAEILRGMAGEADVLVENFRAGTMERLGLGYEDLSALNPRLVYCSISAFGETGPLKDEAGYEAIMQAFSGVMSITGEPDGAPVRCGLSFIDLATGVISAYAVSGRPHPTRADRRGAEGRDLAPGDGRLVAQLPRRGLPPRRHRAGTAGLRSPLDGPLQELPLPGREVHLYRGEQRPAVGAPVRGARARSVCWTIPASGTPSGRVENREEIEEHRRGEGRRVRPRPPPRGAAGGRGAGGAGQHGRPAHERAAGRAPATWSRP